MGIVKGGLKRQILGGFFGELLDLMGEVESAEALYRNYGTYCMAHNVEPAAAADFTAEFRSLLDRIRTEIL